MFDEIISRIRSVEPTELFVRAAPVTSNIRILADASSLAAKAERATAEAPIDSFVGDRLDAGSFPRSKLASPDPSAPDERPTAGTRQGLNVERRARARGVLPPSAAEDESLGAKTSQTQRLENLGQLAGGIAHDFNNLLAVILNYAAFVAEHLSAADDENWPLRVASARSDLAQVTLAAERAANLTRQLLAFARQEVIRPRVLNLDQVISSVEEMLQLTAGDRVELVTSLAGDLWPVLADPNQLQRVLVNLTVNARDAMPDGGTLTIDTRNVEIDAEAIAGGAIARQGRNVRVRVSDTGTGIAADVIEHVFEPFFTTKGIHGGTGLGLSTVYGILSQAEGQIQVHSEDGAGTTVSITLPVTAEENEEMSEPTTFVRIPKGETVLVVEDEDALREVTNRILARHGYHVISAANGPEALDLARSYSGKIHLLVTDVVMPQMLGMEVAEKMKEITPSVEVLFMSGYARPVLASQGRLAPNVALVEKPFSESELLKKVGLALDGHFRGFSTSAVTATPPD